MSTNKNNQKIIKIDSSGWLHISRKGYMKPQYCCNDSNTDKSHCGDWCPHFRTPDMANYDGVTGIALCQGLELKFDTLIDERNYQVE